MVKLTYVVVCRDMNDVEILSEAYRRCEQMDDLIFHKVPDSTLTVMDINSTIVKCSIMGRDRIIYFLLRKDYNKIKEDLKGARNFIIMNAETFNDYFYLDSFNYL